MYGLFVFLLRKEFFTISSAFNFAGTHQIAMAGYLAL